MAPGGSRRASIGAVNRYEIRVVGHLDSSRARALGAARLELLPDGSSRFVVAAADTAALYGLLARLRDAALELIAVIRLPAAFPGRGTPRERSDPS
jgi:hypothetical protein